MSQLDKALRLFSGSMTTTLPSTSGIIPIRTNVINRGGAPSVSVYGNGGSNNGLVQLVDRSIPTFYRIIHECKQYADFELTENIMRLITNNILNLIDEDRYIVEIREPNNSDRKTKVVDKLLKHNRILDMIKSSVWPVIYYGSETYIISRDAKDRKLVHILDIENNHSVILRTSSKSHTYIIEGSEDIEVADNNILYVGPCDFRLDTPSSDYKRLKVKNTTYQPTKGLSVSKYRYFGSKPLYYSITAKIKDYLLRDLLSSVVAIKDAIQQTFMTVDEDLTRYGTVTADLNDMASTIESLINRSTDEGISLANVLDLEMLVNRVLSSVRVIPDPGGSLSKLGSLNMDSLNDKLRNLKDGVDDLKRQILDAIGIPQDLYDGSSNSFESMQKNERLEACITRYMLAIKDAIKELVYKLIQLLDPKLKISKEDIRVTLFRKSAVEYARDNREMNSLKDTMELVTSILDSTNSVLEGNPSIDKSAYYQYIKNNLTNINKDIGSLINPNYVAKEDESATESNIY